MYTNDKTHRITLRLNENQFEFVKSQADMLGVSPSEFLRMVINSAMVTASNVHPYVSTSLSSLGGAIGRENDKADINHKL